MKIKSLLVLLFFANSFCYAQTISLVPNISADDWGYTTTTASVNIPIFTINDVLYFRYETSRYNYQLAKYDGNSITLITNPNSTYSWYGNAYTIMNNILYFRCQTPNSMQLAKYDGNNLIFIPNPTNTGYISDNEEDSPLIFNNMLFMAYKEGSASQLAKYDGNSITLIANPDNNTFYAGSPIAMNNTLYLRYRNNISGVAQLAKYNGNGVTLIANPDNNLGYSGNSVVMNNVLYFLYSSSKVQLAKYDGNNITLIANPDNGNGVREHYIFNNSIYFRYINSSGKSQLGKFDGTTINLISNPDSGNGYNYYTSHVIIGSTLYFGYINSSGKGQLAKYDGNVVTLIANPNNITDYRERLAVINNTLYLLYGNTTGKNQLVKYDGTNFEVLNNPDNGNGFMGPVTTSGSITTPAVVNNVLYLAYSNSLNKVQLAICNGGNINLIPNPNNASYTGSSIALNNKAYFRFHNTSSNKQHLAYLDYSLPITLTFFTGTTKTYGNQLNWQTANETNNKGFEVERKGNDGNFVKIGFVPAGASPSQKQHYGFIDDSPLNRDNYYRLKQLDNDGKFTYVETIVHLNNSLATNQLAIYPNPAKNQLTINGIVSKNDMKIVDNLGRTVKKISVTAATMSVDISTFPSGIYHFSNGVQQGKFVKQ